MQKSEEVEFKALDGLILRGVLYIAGLRSPAVIMTPGFNTTRDVFLPKLAQYFQGKGISSLIYDPRNIGSSDGMPRNNINPAEQVGDYHDALTFLKSDERIDPDRIAYWGFSFSGAVALAAAALDKRSKLVVAVCPLTVWELEPNRVRRVLSKAMQDRESQLSGNAAFSLPMITEEGENPAGYGSGIGPGELSLIKEAQERIENFSVNTTIQSYYNIMAWTPFKALAFIPPTPVLLVTAEDDCISTMENQTNLILNVIKGPKRMHVVPKRGHMNLLDGESFQPVMDVQVDFIRQILGKGLQPN